MFNDIHSPISGNTCHGKKELKKQKETATKLAAHGTKNIRAWFTAPRPKQAPAETEIFTEEPLIRSEAENLNTAETPSQTGNRYL